jgi:type II secretory pathway pseudopilin PulG
MMIVVTLIGILVAVSVPSILLYMRTYKIQAAAQQIASDIQTARLKAVSKNTIHGVDFMVLPPSSPGNAYATPGFTFVLEDLVTGGTGARPGTAALLADPNQIGPIHHLPDGISFIAPAGGANDRGMRFTNLGAMCDPGTQDNSVTTEPCPAFAAGTNYVGFDAGGQATIELEDVRNAPAQGLRVVIRVTRGGRINFERSWQP